MDMGGAGGNFVLRHGRVVRQPGDGSCLFHSMAYGLGGTESASNLRRAIGSFIAGNPDLEICETPMKDWVKWDSNASVSVYARRISRAGWGGGIEMAACSRMKKVREAKRAREQAREWKGRGFLVLPSSAVCCFPPLSLWDVP